MSKQTTVLLYEIGGPALIVPASTEIVYRNQTGGHACLPCQMEVWDGRRRESLSAKGGLS